MKLRHLTLCALAALMASCQPKGPTQEQYDALQSLNDSLTGHVTELQDIIGAVTICLDSIDSQENLIYVNNEDGTKATKKQILERINNYKDLLNRQREELARLEKLDSSNRGSIKQLKAIIARLNEDIQDRELRISILEGELTGKKQDIQRLNTDLTVSRANTARVTQQRDSVEQVATHQRDVMHTAYFIVGSKSELKKAGITKGFFKRKVDYSNLNTAEFTKIDTRNFNQLTIPSRHVKLLSEKPANSYSLYEDGAGNTILTIKDAARFWEASPFLILQSR